MRKNPKIGKNEPVLLIRKVFIDAIANKAAQMEIKSFCAEIQREENQVLVEFLLNLEVNKVSSQFKTLLDNLFQKTGFSQMIEAYAKDIALSAVMRGRAFNYLAMCTSPQKSAAYYKAAEQLGHVDAKERRIDLTQVKPLSPEKELAKKLENCRQFLLGGKDLVFCAKYLGIHKILDANAVSENRVLVLKTLLEKSLPPIEEKEKYQILLCEQAQFLARYLPISLDACAIYESVALLFYHLDLCLKPRDLESSVIPEPFLHFVKAITSRLIGHLDILRKKRDLKLPSYEFYLAQLLWNYDFCLRDFPKGNKDFARELYESAAKAENSDALYQCGVLYWESLISGKSKAEIVSRYFVPSARRNHPDALCFLGKLIWENQHPEIQPIFNDEERAKKAAQYFKKAAEGSIGANEFMTQFFLKGLIFEKNTDFIERAISALPYAKKSNPALAAALEETIQKNSEIQQDPKIMNYQQKIQLAEESLRQLKQNKINYENEKLLPEFFSRSSPSEERNEDGKRMDASSGFFSSKKSEKTEQKRQRTSEPRDNAI